MSAETRPTALIAEDEPLLARALQAELAEAWPRLTVVAVVGDGASAVEQALALKPEVLFFDIRMPGLSGLEAAAELADQWPAGRDFPALVFVSAYDQYAVQAFEAQAVDYLLKPVRAARLQKTVSKLQLALKARAQGAIDSIADMAQTLSQLRALLARPSDGAPARAAAPLTIIQASMPTHPGKLKSALHMVPIGEVLYFAASDKYLRVFTAKSDYLIRTPLRDLWPQLDASVFWQIHRSTVVRADAIESVMRDENGRISLRLRGRPDTMAVSRLYGHLFKAM